MYVLLYICRPRWFCPTLSTTPSTLYRDQSRSMTAVGATLQRMGEELEPSWKHPGLRADVEFAVSLVSPDRAPAVLKWVDSWRTTAEDRARTAFEGATSAAGMSADELLEAIMADERLTDLFRMTMELAARSSSEQKLKALGTALASGVLATDDAEVDEAQLLLRTVGQLEPVDARALALLSQTALDGWMLGHRSNPSLNGPLPPDVPSPAVRAHLEQLGLAREVQNVSDSGDPMGASAYSGGRELDSSYTFEISSYGRTVLAFLLGDLDAGKP